MPYRVLLAVLLLAPAAHAQRFPFGPTVGTSPELKPAAVPNLADNATGTRLENVRAFLAGKQWEEAIENLLPMLENDGDRLIVAAEPHLPAGFQRFVPLRELGQARLAEMYLRAPEALELYRRRVDGLAERWFEDGVARRDSELLRRVVDQAFASRWGDDALYRLGEIALERGEHSLARSCWERVHSSLRTPELISPELSLAAGRSLWPKLREQPLDRVWETLAPWLRQANAVTWLSYPDTNLNLADVRARLVLVSILEGSLDRARWELELLGRLHSDAEGRVGGKRGKYMALLAALIKDAEKWPPLPTGSDGSTLGGSPARQAIASGEVDVGGRPLWQHRVPRIAVPPQERAGVERVRVAEDASGLLGYHPVIANGLVFWSEPNYVKAFRLRDDRPAWPTSDASESDPGFGRVYTAFGEGERFSIHPDRPFVGVARFTVTVSHGRLFARMKSPVTGGDRELPVNQRSLIVGLDLGAEGKLLPGFPLTTDGPEWAFEGTPLADDSRLWVALRNHDGDHAGANVACYDMQAGRRLWRKQIASAEVPGQGQWQELSHNLLTLAGGSIFYNTNLGAVTALSARDGTVQWTVTYPRAEFHPPDSDEPGRYFFRDLNPCVVYKDWVLVAPADCDRIFAVDVSSGQLVWSTPRGTASDAVHLLGVADDHLLVSGDYLYWIDVHTGRVDAQFPEPLKSAVGHAMPTPRGFGRGLLAGDQIYFPTRERIYVFRQRLERTSSGREPVPSRQPIELQRDYGISGGNLLVADGVLVVATADRIVALKTP